MKKLVLKYAMLCLVLLMVSCSEDTDYVKVIPSDATTVIAYDCKHIIEKSGLFSNEAPDSQKEFVESHVSRLPVGKEELIRRIIDNPGESGIDFNKPMYSFVTADTDTWALALPVIDAQKVKTALEVLADSNLKGGKFTEEEGFAWSRLMANSQSFYIAVNEKVLVVVCKLGSEKRNTIKDRVAIWLNQTEEQSFVTNKYYEKLLDVKGEIKGYFAMTDVPEEALMATQMIYSDNFDFGKVKYLSGISFEKGQLKFDGNLLYEDEKMHEWLKEQEKVCKKIDGKSLQNYPLSTSVWFSMGLNGDKLYDHLLDHPVYGKELEEMRLPFNLEGIIRSIDGDISLGYPTGIRMDVKNKELLKILVGTAKTMGSLIGVQMDETAPDQYKLYGQTISRFKPEGRKLHPYVGMKDDTFYLMSDSLSVGPLSKEQSLASAPWANSVEGNILFVAFNFNKGSNLLNMYTTSSKQSRMLKKYFDYITLSQHNIESNQFVLSFVDKEKNILQQFIEMYLQMN